MAILAPCRRSRASPPTNPGTGTGTTPTTPVVSETKVAVTMVDGSGNPISSLAGGQSATLRATVVSPSGQPAANTIVEFATASSNMVVFTPGTGST
ncbi:hypothetical protein G4G28_02610 [Massilia sp. Dwa41.01b]|uniref:hypothetical protein n=1 Tax=Massilia sp. Dwa41.01b TaxID=2709302 RepID=UPI0016010669|nr:hypothetical protein [Massilia sp. Dwa41.01b]QNA87643.1 hypothetical protein G4G28_02610 [Massilia sp. Dwa41.01b]